MIDAYLATMFAVVLLDIFDKLVARYGIRPKPCDLIPPAGLVFGVIEDVRRHGFPKEVRFLYIPIPFVKTWGVLNPFQHPLCQEYGFRSHRLRWLELDDPEYGGWRIDPPFPE